MFIKLTMKGKDVKDKLLNSGYKLKDVAENMGILPQTLQSLLQAEDIKTGVLEKIAKSINKNTYFFFDEKIGIEYSESESLKQLIKNNTILVETNQKLVNRILELTDTSKQNIADAV